MIKDAFIFLIALEIIGSIILFFGFYFTPIDINDLNVKKDSVTNAYNDFGKSLWAAIFHSISAINNAGFYIISGSPLVPYNQPRSTGYLIQVTFLFQWVIGWLSYPTYHDIKKN